MKKKPNAIIQGRYKDRMTAAGYIPWNRWIKPKWKQQFEDLLAKLKSQDP